MFDLSISFSQFCPAIYGEKIDFFFSISTLKWFWNAKKSGKNAQNLSPFLLMFKIKLNIFYQEIRFLKIVFWDFFRGNIVDCTLRNALAIKKGDSFSSFINLYLKKSFLSIEPKCVCYDMIFFSVFAIN